MKTIDGYDVKIFTDNIEENAFVEAYAVFGFDFEDRFVVEEESERALSAEAAAKLVEV